MHLGFVFEGRLFSQRNDSTDLSKWRVLLCFVSFQVHDFTLFGSMGANVGPPQVSLLPFFLGWSECRQLDTMRPGRVILYYMALIP